MIDLTLAGLPPVPLQDRDAAAAVASGAAGITVQALDFYYGSTRALKNISLVIPAQGITAIIGPSGCGKSTLLRTFNRMDARHRGSRAEGQVLIGGRNVLSPGYPLHALRKQVGMVFQRPVPFPMTVFENVAWGLRHHEALARAELAQRVEQALRDAALWDEVKDGLRKSALGLSGGQQQRLCIARAIALKPSVLLLDEPTSALDPAATARIESLVHALKRRHTVVIVTHNMQQARRVSDHAAFLYLGELIESGPTQQVFGNPSEPRTRAYVSGHFG